MHLPKGSVLLLLLLLLNSHTLIRTNSINHPIKIIVLEGPKHTEVMDDCRTQPILLVVLSIVLLLTVTILLDCTTVIMKHF